MSVRKANAAMFRGFFLLFIATLLLSGCAPTVGVYKIGADSGLLSLVGTIKAGGCQVEVNNPPKNLYVHFRTDDCEVEYGTPSASEDTL